MSNVLPMAKSASQAVKNTCPTLVVFCKRPKLNQGKQRLVETMSAEHALIIANALLACAIEDTKAWQGPVVIACSDESDITWAQSLNTQAHVITQLPEGLTGNLGQRLNYVDHQLRLLGHQQLVIIGTDAPMLNNTHYQDVITSMSQHDVVLSHADDGGVVIMANSAPWPNIAKLPWSTEHLSHALAEICRENNLAVHYAKPGYDIDYITDIEKLMIDLKNDHRRARQALLGAINQLFFLSGATRYA